MAVGNFATAHNVYPLTEQWNGHAWRIVAAPSPPGASATYLNDISCAGSTACEAVGFVLTTNSSGESEHALAEVWNGTSWHLQPIAQPGGPSVLAGLTSVSCSSSAACEAVGGFVGGVATAQEQPLAERWDGKAWALQPTPNPQAENGSSLVGLSCPAANACAAGGLFDYADVNQSIFAFQWNGRSWTEQRQPNPQGQQFNGENAVSCATRVRCMAVGFWTDTSGDSRPLTELSDGVNWTFLPAPGPSGATTTLLAGVSCPGPVACIAVGSWSASPYDNPELTLAERWDGHGWRIQTTPNPAGGKISGLSGVSCLTPTGALACVAVGNSWNGISTQAISETFRG
jgi:hypothetical protein